MFLRQVTPGSLAQDPGSRIELCSEGYTAGNSLAEGQGLI